MLRGFRSSDACHPFRLFLLLCFCGLLATDGALSCVYKLAPRVRKLMLDNLLPGNVRESYLRTALTERVAAIIMNHNAVFKAFGARRLLAWFERIN